MYVFLCIYIYYICIQLVEWFGYVCMICHARLMANHDKVDHESIGRDGVKFFLKVGLMN